MQCMGVAGFVVLYLISVSLVESVHNNHRQRTRHHRTRTEDLPHATTMASEALGSDDDARPHRQGRIRTRHVVSHIPSDNGDEGDEESLPAHEEEWNDYDDFYSYEEELEDENNCTQCVFREQVRTVRLEFIRREILSKLGFTEAPNVTSNVVPNHPSINSLIEVNDMQSDSPGPSNHEEYVHDYRARTLRVFTFPVPPPSSLHINYTNALYFNYTPEIGTSVLHAQLYVYVRPYVAMEARTLMYIRYYRLAPPQHPGEMPVKVRRRTWFVEKKHSVPANGAWYHLEVGEWLDIWGLQPHNNYGMVVEAVDVVEQQQVVMSPANESYKPLIQIRLSDARHRRQRRAALPYTCHSHSKEKRCCKFRLEVNFNTDFGWDWIISPRKYHANYCSGECPFSFMQQYSHTHVVQQANPSGSNGPCCAPIEMQPLSLLYFESPGVVAYGAIPHMSVERCACS